MYLDAVIVLVADMHLIEQHLDEVAAISLLERHRHHPLVIVIEPPAPPPSRDRAIAEAMRLATRHQETKLSARQETVDEPFYRKLNRAHGPHYRVRRLQPQL